jgi:hypothetical protein
MHILLQSSLLFITNCASAYYCEYYLYSLFFCLLTITSLIFHSNKTLLSNLLDKCSIISIVLYGAYLFFNKFNNEKMLISSCIITTFLLVIYFYYYGYFIKHYCFNKNKNIGTLYHCLIHIITCIGHHLIIIM